MHGSALVRRLLLVHVRCGGLFRPAERVPAGGLRHFAVQPVPQRVAVRGVPNWLAALGTPAEQLADPVDRRFRLGGRRRLAAVGQRSAVPGVGLHQVHTGRVRRQGGEPVRHRVDQRHAVLGVDHAEGALPIRRVDRQHGPRADRLPGHLAHRAVVVRHLVEFATELPGQEVPAARVVQLARLRVDLEAVHPHLEREHGLGRVVPVGLRHAVGVVAAGVDVRDLRQVLAEELHLLVGVAGRDAGTGALDRRVHRVRAACVDRRLTDDVGRPADVAPAVHRLADLPGLRRLSPGAGLRLGLRREVGHRGLAAERPREVAPGRRRDLRFLDIGQVAVAVHLLLGGFRGEVARVVRGDLLEPDHPLLAAAGGLDLDLFLDHQLGAGLVQDLVFRLVRGQRLDVPTGLALDDHFDVAGPLRRTEVGAARTEELRFDHDRAGLVPAGDDGRRLASHVDPAHRLALIGGHLVQAGCERTDHRHDFVEAPAGAQRLVDLVEDRARGVAVHGVGALVAHVPQGRVQIAHRQRFEEFVLVGEPARALVDDAGRELGLAEGVEVGAVVGAEVRVRDVRLVDDRTVAPGGRVVGGPLRLGCAVLVGRALVGGRCLVAGRSGLVFGRVGLAALGRGGIVRSGRRLVERAPLRGGCLVADGCGGVLGGVEGGSLGGGCLFAAWGGGVFRGVERAPLRGGGLVADRGGRVLRGVERAAFGGGCFVARGGGRVLRRVEGAALGGGWLLAARGGGVFRGVERAPLRGRGLVADRGGRVLRGVEWGPVGGRRLLAAWARVEGAAVGRGRLVGSGGPLGGQRRIAGPGCRGLGGRARLVDLLRRARQHPARVDGRARTATLLRGRAVPALRRTLRGPVRRRLPTSRRLLLRRTVAALRRLRRTTVRRRTHRAPRALRRLTLERRTLDGTALGRAVRPALDGAALRRLHRATLHRPALDRAALARLLGTALRGVPLERGALAWLVGCALGGIALERRTLAGAALGRPVGCALGGVALERRALAGAALGRPVGCALGGVALERRALAGAALGRPGGCALGGVALERRALAGAALRWPVRAALEGCALRGAGLRWPVGCALGGVALERRALGRAVLRGARRLSARPVALRRAAGIALHRRGGRRLWRLLLRRSVARLGGAAGRAEGAGGVAGGGHAVRARRRRVVGPEPAARLHRTRSRRDRHPVRAAHRGAIRPHARPTGRPGRGRGTGRRAHRGPTADRGTG
ncbi:hypothetical protein EDD35_3443 [Amycolatopsis thermoflava]|uniref:Uncharacterized protein n=1 Tax=Amycolatopsis thermoflava TaxID=84480 RepID=A0A3N2GWW1_9PSEU|nr:hypothetical protein EDD35_3443 [Amycolatopsis thermoflava]